MVWKGRRDGKGSEVEATDDMMRSEALGGGIITMAIIIIITTATTMTMTMTMTMTVIMAIPHLQYW